MRPMIDAHLDLAWAAIHYNRDMLASVADVRRAEAGVTDEKARGRNTLTFVGVGRAGGPVGVATLMARSGPGQEKPSGTKRTDLDYFTQEIAYSDAHGHLAYYRLLEGLGHVKIITTRGGLRSHFDAWTAAPDTS